MSSMQLPASRRRLLLGVHIAATVGVFGAALGVVSLGVGSVAGADPLTIYPAARMIAANVISPLSIVALGSGVLLALLTPWGLFTYWWVTIKLVGTALLNCAVLFYVVPQLSGTERAVLGPNSALLTTAERVPLLAGPAVAASLILLALLLAIYKPGGRLRRLHSSKSESRPLHRQPESYATSEDNRYD